MNDIPATDEVVEEFTPEVAEEITPEVASDEVVVSDETANTDATDVVEEASSDETPAV